MGQIRYYGEYNHSERRYEGLLKITDWFQAEYMTGKGWLRDDSRAPEVMEFGIHPISEQIATQIARDVFGRAL